MGPLPPAGEWVRLEVAASAVGLENRVVHGMAFTLSGGRATWDRAGRVGYREALKSDEAAYRWEAYLALLGATGTSYEEARLARAAEPGERAALADKLGFDLGPARPDRLDELLRKPGDVTEEYLERIFGLATTTRNPVDPSVLSELLRWRLERLQATWKRQDHPAPPAADDRPGPRVPRGLGQARRG
jgi:hypothetical protein